MILVSEHIKCFFFSWTESTASSPTLTARSASKQCLTRPPPLFSPPISFSFFLCVFTCLLSSSSSRSSAESSQVSRGLWERSDLTPWSLTQVPPLDMQCSYHAGQRLSCPLSLFLHLFTGLGYCLTFLPTVTILAQYFSRRRALVTSVASSGESFAIFAFAPGEWI